MYQVLESWVYCLEYLFNCFLHLHRTHAYPNILLVGRNYKYMYLCLYTYTHTNTQMYMYTCIHTDIHIILYTLTIALFLLHPKYTSTHSQPPVHHCPRSFPWLQALLCSLGNQQGHQFLNQWQFLSIKLHLFP